MSLKKRMDALVQLGDDLMQRDDTFAQVASLAKSHNGWFTAENIDKAIHSICHVYLDRQKLEKWIANYQLADSPESKTIALITAGNIPLVGIHDIITIYLSGHNILIKPSSKDKVLTEYVIDKLKAIDSGASIEVITRLEKYDAVITTSTNSNATTFEYYFKHVPNIIRRNRNSIAVFHGDETVEDMKALAHDVFDYYGLGCRNVSAIMFPEGYDFQLLMGTLDESREVANHHKYKNNYDYNNAIFILNKENFLANDCILLRKHDDLVSRIGTLHYQNYKDIKEVQAIINANKENLQCVVSKHAIEDVDTVPLGMSQRPELWDYADGVDTMAFLQNL